MEETITLATKIHMYVLYLMLFFSLFSLSLVFRKDKNKDYFSKISFFTPMYHFLSSIVLFTGLILWAFINFKFSFFVLAMVFTWTFILATSIKNYKIFKRARVDKSNLKEFKKFTSIKYSADFLLILGLSLF